ncbi:uncharacterized protein AMSG_03277 [Thecamonas trahens ATCC 50062]|uniref:Uncharacterized protein n=1 Tax=Thecamonas trahens ATCC 50062 TaxID=461836 RepID=A0A0L0D3D2_THETB|nr:hypothetical protein AMSG_03277 [Thecamonas trahens ATCC 50062]KNC46847.1 hypothetical protein AMSG_03277 [Thecamonas trahens ATCC 50062]|eukprot:XP_013760120.1 hypothetical protein AMSG_03277 [Thecamonas trahens ATCC 50062]
MTEENLAAVVALRENADRWMLDRPLPHGWDAPLDALLTRPQIMNIAAGEGFFIAASIAASHPTAQSLALAIEDATPPPPPVVADNSLYVAGDNMPGTEAGRDGDDETEWMATVTKFHAAWYHCDEEDDSGWGCGFRVVQMLAHAASGPHAVPSIADIVAACNASPRAEPVVWGEWLAVDALAGYLGAAHGLLECSMMSVDAIDKLDVLALRLQHHLSAHNTMAVFEGTGQIFCVAGVRSRLARREVLIVDPHGPPSAATRTESGVLVDFAFHGGIGWIELRELLLNTARVEAASAFGGDLPPDNELLRLIGGWRVLFLSKTP